MKRKTKRRVNKWIQGTAKKEGAVRHPGALKRAAAQHGKSTLAEAKSEAKSPNRKIAARGRLGLRFLGKAKHGNIRKKHSRKRVSSKA